MLNLFRKLHRVFYRKIFYLSCSHKFKKYGRNIRLSPPLKIEGAMDISIEDNVIIGDQVWLEANNLTNSEYCELSIGTGCILGNYNHIYATKSIIFEEFVLTADKVYISDNIHDYTDINTPILNQGIIQKSTVVIGRGSWVGENVCIIGAKIGKNCVIGSNSVVTKDIPDFCVAAGNPARVIKKYNIEKNKWEKINE